MQVGHQEEALIRILELDPVGKRADVVAYMELASRPISCEEPLSVFH
jgi:hypothetical protein